MKQTIDLTKPELTEEEIRRSQEITAEHDLIRPRASRAYYFEEEDKVVIILKNYAELRIPSSQIQGLRNATPEQIAGVQLTASGNALHWESLDVQMSIEGLMSGVLGTEQWMRSLRNETGMANIAASHLGHLGGKARTPAKIAASRANGKKGGRPRLKTEVA